MNEKQFLELTQNKRVILISKSKPTYYIWKCDTVKKDECPQWIEEKSLAVYEDNYREGETPFLSLGSYNFSTDEDVDIDVYIGNYVVYNNRSGDLMLFESYEEILEMYDLETE